MSALVAIATVGYLAVAVPLPLPLAGTSSYESARKAFAASDVAANERILPVEVTVLERATGFEVDDQFVSNRSANCILARVVA